MISKNRIIEKLVKVESTKGTTLASPEKRELSQYINSTLQRVYENDNNKFFKGSPTKSNSKHRVTKTGFFDSPNQKKNYHGIKLRKLKIKENSNVPDLKKVVTTQSKR